MTTFVDVYPIAPGERNTIHWRRTRVPSGIIPVSFDQPSPPHLGAVLYSVMGTHWIEMFPGFMDPLMMAVYQVPSVVHVEADVGSIEVGPDGMPTDDSLQRVMDVAYKKQQGPKADRGVVAINGVIIPCIPSVQGGPYNSQVLNVDAGLQWAQRWEKDPPPYNVASWQGLNCVSFVRYVMVAAGWGDDL